MALAHFEYLLDLHCALAPFPPLSLLPKER